MKSKALIIFVFLFVALSSFAQNKIDKEEWSRLRKDLRYGKEEKDANKEDWAKNYDESPEEESRWGKEFDERDLKGKVKRSEREPDPPVGKSYGVSGPVYLIITIIVIVILLVVVYLLFKNSSVSINKKIKIEEDEPIQIEKPYDELEELLKRSIESGNYREAVRIYFIFIIKHLRERNWITWERKKTNTAYLYEMRSRKEYDSFSKVVFFFEVIWYGKRDISEEQFNSIRPSFDAFLKSVKSANE